MAKTVTLKEEVEVLTPEVIEEINQKIETSLVKENITDKIIAKLKEDYLPLKIKDQDDKEGFLAVQSARKHCKSIRVIAKKICEHGRAEANAISQAWIDKQKDVVAQILEVEDALQALEDGHLAEKERLKAEKAAKIEKQGAERMSDLIRFGASLQGLNWVLGDVSYENQLIKETDPEIYAGIRAEYESQFNVNEAAKLKEQEMVKEEAAELQRQQNALKEQQAELQRQQEALKAQQEKARKELGQRRRAQLEALGMRFDAFADQFEGHGVKIALTSFRELLEAQDEQWDAAVQALSTEMDIAKEAARIKKEEEDHIAEEKRQQDLENAKVKVRADARFKSLQDIGFTYPFDDLGTMSDLNYSSMFDEHNKHHQKKLHEKWVADKNEEARIAEEKEKERQELLGEKQRYEELVKAFKAVQIPAFKSGQYRAKVVIIRDFIDGLK